MPPASNTTSHSGPVEGEQRAAVATWRAVGHIGFNSTYSPSTNVYVTAYSGSGHHVIVAINMGSSAVSQPFPVQDVTISSLTPHQTSPSGNLVQLGAVSLANDAFTYTLPGQSITTFAN